MKETVFELLDVSFYHMGRYPALEAVNMEVRPRESIALLGANGSGKTSLLHILNGLYHPQQGEVRFWGMPLTKEALGEESFRRSFRKTVGLLFQNPEAQLFCPTVWEEIAFGPLQLDLPREEVEERVEDLLELLNIRPLRERAPHQLSLGEKKKVALASTLALNPSVLLLDEPTAGLDPRSQGQLVDLAIAFHEAGKTLITATHDLHLVSEVADMVYVLSEEKRIVARGTPHEVLSEEEMLHQWNLLHTHQHRHGGKWHLHSHSHIGLHDHKH